MLKSIYIKTKKLIVRKNKGNITSLIFGQLFMLVLLIWCMYVFRIEMINLTFQYIDDSVTDALLGSALVNIEEYGKSKQIIIHDNDVYKDVTHTGGYTWSDNETYRKIMSVTTDSDVTKGWSEKEANILLSEYNYGSDIVLTYDVLSQKQELDIASRASSADASSTIGSNTSNLDSTNSDNEDTYLRRSLSAFIGNLRYNLSSGVKGGIYSASGTQLATVNTSSLNKNDAFNINFEVPNSTFLGTYLTDKKDNTIEVTDFEIYSVYRANLAQRHVYQSEYMTYNTTEGTLNGTLKTGEEELKVTGWNSKEPGAGIKDYTAAYTEFKNKYKPFKYLAKSDTYKVKDGEDKIYTVTDTDNYKEEVSIKYRSKSEAYDDQVKNYCDTTKINKNYGEELIQYYRKLRHWRRDWYSYYITCDGNTSGLVCFTDSKTTYQGSYTDKTVSSKQKSEFKYFYTLNGVSLNDVSLNGDTSHADKVTLYYQNSEINLTSDKTVTKTELAPIVGYSHYQYRKTKSDTSSTATTTMDYTTETFGNKTVQLKIPVKNSKQSTIEDTSLYTEVTFQMRKIPWLWGNGFELPEVTISKLISVELNE